MKQRRPDDVIRCSADADPMSKTIIGPMKLSVIGPMKHPSWTRHRADEVVLVGNVDTIMDLLYGASLFAYINLFCLCLYYFYIVPVYMYKIMQAK